jgi:hypothetical protein
MPACGWTARCVIKNWADLTFQDLRHVATTRLKVVHDDALNLSKTTGHEDLRSLARLAQEALVTCTEKTPRNISKTGHSH